MVALHHTLALGCDLIEDKASPNITILHGVETIIAGTHEFVKSIDIANFIILPPVLSELKLGLLWVSVFVVSEVVNHEGHVSAPLSKQTQRFHISLHDRAGASYRTTVLSAGEEVPGAGIWSWGIMPGTVILFNWGKSSSASSASSLSPECQPLMIKVY